MSRFYTNVTIRGDKVLYRGYEDGERVEGGIDYRPTLFVSTNKSSKYHTIHGHSVESFQPGSMSDCRDFIERHESVTGFEIYGNTDYTYQFIGDKFPDEVDYSMKTLKVGYIDIETTSENGFPQVTNPQEKVNVITLAVEDRTYVFGLGDFQIDDPDIIARRYDDEVDLMLEFLEVWKKEDVDIITGWNVKFFDIPYLYARMDHLIEKKANGLSPWNWVRKRDIQTQAGDRIAYEVVGRTILDYFDLYQKFTYVNQESYKLDHIAFVELGEKKLEYEYDHFKDFYTNDFQKFVEYNIQDVRLIQKLEKKLGLMELAMALAYNAKVNLGDVFSQVRMWDQIIYHYLRGQDIVIPRKKAGGKKENQIIGAYVKEPITGRHDWIVSFDLNSLYPHLIMQYNISPDTKMRPDGFPRNPCIDVDGVLGETDLCEKNLKQLKRQNFSIAANGVCFRKDRLGFMPKLMEKFYAERKHFKKLMIEAEKKKQKDPNNEELDFEIAKYHNFQLVRKIQLNSAYGAMGNQYFRYFDTYLAEAITTSGQLSIQYIANELNAFLNKTLNTGDYDYVVASDTDSVYLRLGNLVRAAAQGKSEEEIVRFLDKSCKEIIEPFIKKAYETLAAKMNAHANKMVMEREVIADVGVWTAKKRYMLNVHNSEGVQYDEPKMKIMGIETTRSSTPMVVRQKLKDAIKLVLTGTEDQVIDFIDDFKQEFKKYSPDEIAFPRGCNNLITYQDETYIYRKSTPIAVKGALIYNHFLKKMKLTDRYYAINEGDKVKFLYLAVPNPFQNTVISFPGSSPKEFELKDYADYDKQFAVSFLEPLKNILEKVGWDHERRATLF
jgi:DNA polymerase elongation subunit (family B)